MFHREPGHSERPRDTSPTLCWRGLFFFLELGDLGESPAWDLFLYVVFPVSWTANLHSYK